MTGLFCRTQWTFVLVLLFVRICRAHWTFVLILLFALSKHA